MKALLIKSLAFSFIFLLSTNTVCSAQDIETINALSMSSEQWQEVGNLWLSSFFEAYKNLPLSHIDSAIEGETEEALINWLKDLFNKYRIMARKGSYVFTFFSNKEKIIGYILHHLLPQSSIMHIDHFVVDPNYQGQGIGKKLLASVIKNNQAIESIVLTTRILNISAQGFYKHLGFYETTEHLESVKFDPLYSIVLKKDLI